MISKFYEVSMLTPVSSDVPSLVEVPRPPAPPRVEPWVPRNLPIDVAREKMWKNEEKAIRDHRGPGYISLAEFNTIRKK